MSGIALRPAVASDAARLSRIAFAAKAALGYAPELLEAWRGALTIDAATLRHEAAWLAERGGEALGFFSLRFDADAAALTHLWVVPAAQRCGVGSLLMRKALELVAASGARRACAAG